MFQKVFEDDDNFMKTKNFEIQDFYTQNYVHFIFNNIFMSYVVT